MPATWTIDERELRFWGREHKWYTNRDIAIGLGVAPSTLSRVVSGKSEPGHALLARMRLIFGDEAFAAITGVVELGEAEA